MKKFLPFIVLALLNVLTPSVNAQKNDFIAKVGKDVITTGEYKERYELMPIVSKHRNIDSVKHELLYTLIAENLAAKEAEKLHLDKKPAFTDIYSALEKMFVRDALFKEEIESKIKIGAEELKEGIDRVSTELKVNIMSSADSAEIFDLYRQLSAGAKFDSLLAMRPEYIDQKEPLSVTFGTMEDKKVEDLLFNLKVNSFSGPVQTKDGWFIFYVKDWTRTSGQDFEKIQSEAKKTIKARKRKILALNYMDSILHGMSITADTAIFRKLIYTFSEELSGRDTSANKSEDGSIQLSVADVDRIKSLLGNDMLKKVFIPFKKDPVTVNEFLNYFYHSEFKVKATDEKTMAGKLAFDYRNFVQVEMMSREGYKKGLDKLPSVQHDLKMWKNNYLSQLYRISLNDSAKVSDDEVIKYYNERYKTDKKETTVKVIEFLSPDLSVMETALNRLQSGNDFKASLADIKGGTIQEPADFPVTENGEIGRIAGTLNVGEIYGPVDMGGQFVIFKLLDKKESDIMPSTYEDVKETLRGQLINRKIYTMMKDKIVNAAANADITVNEKALSDLQVTSINMFVFRHMGFGGRIWGVPYSPPFYEWMHEVKNVKRVLP